jgi:hypothetical protein
MVARGDPSSIPRLSQFMGLVKKIPSLVKLGISSLLLMKTVGWSLPHRLKLYMAYMSEY